MNGWMVQGRCLKLLSLIKIVYYKYFILYSIVKLHVFNSLPYMKDILI